MPVAAIAKQLVRSSVTLTALAFAAHDLALGWRLARGDRGTTLGVAAGIGPPAEGADYVEQIHRWYIEAAGLPAFRGRVAEIGPGDSLGIGLLCRAGGAEHYVGVDRFAPYHDVAHQRAIYEVLAERVGRPDLLTHGTATGVKGVDYAVGEGAETYFRPDGPRYDVILSNAVLEHCQDPLAALDAMLAALAPGGLMVQIVDLRDHGMFKGRHPLTHLTVPDWLWQLMVRNSGRPNRVPFSAYRAWLDRTGANGVMTPTWLIGGNDGLGVATTQRDAALALVRDIRPRLAEPFRYEADDDLAVATWTLVVRR
ncbi:MAG TPA: methyltransferase domain-containing protein [Stellaceae bacterium]|nr:methyltransferase domain-containing protein [Stellaceae bacterium]